MPGTKNAKEQIQCRSQFVPPRRHESATYWGPFPLPGNKKGHIGSNEQSFILQRTGWKVSTRFRGNKKNKKGEVGAAA